LWSKPTLGSLILLGLALSVISIVSVTPVYSNLPALTVTVGSSSVMILYVGGSLTKPPSTVAVIGDGNNTASVFSYSGVISAASTLPVQRALVSVIVDGKNRCNSYSNQYGWASYSCRVPVGPGSHQWYVTASMHGYISGQSPTYSFFVVSL
jgi:hypothetical protein